VGEHRREIWEPQPDRGDGPCDQSGQARLQGQPIPFSLRE
jgi:hypothetical protein